MIEISIAQSFILDPKGQNISIRVNPPPLSFYLKRWISLRIFHVYFSLSCIRI